MSGNGSDTIVLDPQQDEQALKEKERLAKIEQEKKLEKKQNDVFFKMVGYQSHQDHRFGEAAKVEEEAEQSRHQGSRKEPEADSRAAVAGCQMAASFRGSHESPG